MAEAITLAEFERAEEKVAAEGARSGFKVHATVFVLVNLLLIIINLTNLSDQGVWFFYPLIGWGIGLTMHYLMGVRRVKQNVADHQAKVERQVLTDRGER